MVHGANPAMDANALTMGLLPKPLLERLAGQYRDSLFQNGTF
jgi:hypothetical protein